jgi:hypothetical protein
MKKRDRLHPPRNPDFIAGIYNYCDRWCERCAFTARCMVFATEQADNLSSGERDLKNKAFWKRLEESLKATGEMVREMARERGIELDPREIAVIVRERERKERRAKNHPLAQAAFNYTHRVDSWFEDEKTLLYEKEEEVKTKARLGVAGVKEEVAGLTDVVEIIRWYQHQIYVKLMRGLDADDEDEAISEFPRDSDGSVKVALIAMDRSIAAWLGLNEFFPDKTDSILTMLVHLDRLRRAAEKQFPNARSFVRPGFDSGESPE